MWRDSLRVLSTAWATAQAAAPRPMGRRGAIVLVGRLRLNRPRRASTPAGSRTSEEALYSGRCATINRAQLLALARVVGRRVALPHD